MKIKKIILKLLPYRAKMLLKNIRSNIHLRYVQISHVKISKMNIVRDLQDLGIKKGDTILVHSSLKNIGFVEGGADTVIDAFIEVIGSEGTLTMPCFSLNGSMAETLEHNVIFNPQSSPSSTGIITETFRKRPGVLRSIHPTHSICAYGSKAQMIISGHENAGTNFGPGTPLFKFMEEDGLIVGLGIDFGPVTFVHVIEDTIKKFPVNVYYDKKYIANVIDNTGKKKYMKIKAHNPETSKTRIDKQEGKWIRQFFFNYLITKGLLRTGHVGEANTWVIKAKHLFEVQRELLNQGITIYTTEEQYRQIQQRNSLNDNT